MAGNMVRFRWMSKQSCKDHIGHEDDAPVEEGIDIEKWEKLARLGQLDIRSLS